MREAIAIVDFGSQYTQLIARRVREQRVFCRIYPCSVDPADLALQPLKGLILSGGPASVYEAGAPELDPRLLDLGVPVLGICYGLQAMVAALGGAVARGVEGGEYGRATLTLRSASDLLSGVPRDSVVWMSHGDQVERLPDGFEVLAGSKACPFAAIAERQRRLYGLQFHPEVTHTAHGPSILRNFLFGICGVRGDWTMASFVDTAVRQVQDTVGSAGRVVLGMSGGVDSSVAAVLLHRAVGERLDAIFVDNGLLRKNERENVAKTFLERFEVRLHVVDAGDAFLADLAGVTDPEEKRRRIGHRFIEVFRGEARRCAGAGFLAQGTLYPDVIESLAPRGGPSATIKTHHNVGGLPEELGFTLVEPFRELFKDEVRALGALLGLPESILRRHPFPGPGLAVRILGEVTPERLEILREADAIFREELRLSGWRDRVAQAFVVLLPVRTVGVQGDQRTYGYACAIRAITTEDFMTAEPAPLPHDLLARMASRITNEVRAINRVTYDVTSKPPATIEWE
ncbi:MAG: glutamine-hydrolyzing GMP synthase [Planctomycetes bacterium]|nr:glutamine-hydrolyzing GMP synthase [Planctomycetota bacterium]